uniref:K Homology domain-containing protein n=1 Tax=Setaria digitata TaxID=48799 RepID=A0A915PMD1_9BILA
MVAQEKNARGMSGIQEEDRARLIVMKRQRIEDPYGYSYGYGTGLTAGKRQRQDSYQKALAEGKYELRLLVTSRGAGAIIGKKGESVKNIQTECDATVSVPDSQTPERVVQLVATVENVVKCVEMIISRIDEVHDNQDRDSELKVLVHQSHAGAVIGRGGSRIKELREENGVDLKVYSECCPQSTERIIQINGKPEKIVACLITIINTLKEIPIKGPSRPYESIFFDPMVANEYGGYAGDHGGRGMRGYGPRGRIPLPPYGPVPPAYDDGPLETAQVTVPNELGGTIIGRGGERIRRIRDESGAHIKIEEENPNGERIITISGTPSQIEMAQFLLQQCVRSSAAGRKYLSAG